MQTGALVISLDFELHWGVRDHCAPNASYARNLFGARKAIPRILDLFEEYEVAATWAAVGFLFAISKSELLQFYPRRMPLYQDASLNPYTEKIGEDERADPVHYAWSLLDEIRRRKRQEIATHTFSHFYCLEPQSEQLALHYDLNSAVRLAAKRGIQLRSIVFPRNQVSMDALAEASRFGIVAYRGAEVGWMYRPCERRDDHSFRRVGRLLDRYMPLTGSQAFGWDELQTSTGLYNVRGSAFLRPYSPASRLAEVLRIHRIEQEIRSAAARGEIFHLWWHPHNFGTYIDENLSALRRILDVAGECRNRFGLESLTMLDVAERAAGRSQTLNFSVGATFAS